MSRTKTSRKQKTKRSMRGRHNGRLEISKGGTFIGRWMIAGQRFSESSGIKIADYNGDEIKAREAAEDWLARKLATYKAADAVKKIERDESTILAAQKVIFDGALKQIDERRATATDEIPPIKIADAFDRFLKSLNFDKTTAPSTVRMMRQRFGRFTSWMQTNYTNVTTMREVTPAIAKQFAEDLNASLGAGTYNGYLVTIGQIWKALADEINSPSPWVGIKRQTVGKTHRRALTDAELDALFAGAHGDKDMTMLLSLMLYAGMRLSDAACMRWESVRFDRGVLDFEAIKTGSRCKPPLVPALRQMLEQTPPDERTGYIIPKFAKVYGDNPVIMSGIVTTFFKKCGIETSIKIGGYGRRHPAATPHSMRHTFVSKCGAAGVPLAIVQGWVGHMSEDMTRHYFHDDDKATLFYARCIAQMDVPAPTLVNVTEDVQTVEAEIVQPDTEDAADGRFRRFCDALDGMDAEELDRAAAEIARRRGKMV